MIKITLLIFTINTRNTPKQTVEGITWPPRDYLNDPKHVWSVDMAKERGNLTSLTNKPNYIHIYSHIYIHTVAPHQKMLFPKNI